jgi:peptidoglycan/LPS O-acetylase OafA/YrhL
MMMTAATLTSRSSVRTLVVHPVEAVRPSGYRPDIDGLRALAVVMVVVYHLQLHGSHGGFVGVDIFFVVSGYLITSIILRELGKSRFTIGSFYVRRIRRILPAFLIVVLAVSVAGYRYMLPMESLNYAKSLLASIFFGSNFFFWMHSGYFDPQAAAMPLLHTWSLSIEEQFYLLFPGLLIVLHRYKKEWLFKAVLTIGAVSFVLNLFSTYSNATAAFYNPLTRTWELLAGSLLAMKPLPSVRGSAVARNVSTAAGLALIAFCALAYYPFTRFPGIAALPPCLAAVLIIGGGEFGPTVVGRLLSWRPIVFIGLISYSLYLWHWPVIVFLDMRLTRTAMSTVTQQALALVLSVILAVLSWRFVEQPFRHGAAPQRTVFRYAAIGMSVPILVALLVFFLKGAPYRYKAEAVTVASYLQPSDTASRYRTGVCFVTFGFPFKDFDPTRCLSASPALPNYLVLGDSHAAQLVYGLRRKIPEVNWMQATASGCKPVVSWQEHGGAEDCLHLMNFILQDYLQKSPTNTVVLAADWSSGDQPGVDATIRYIQQLGKNVLVIGPIVEYSVPLPRLLAVGIQNSDRTLANRYQVTSIRTLDETMKQRAHSVWQVPYFSYFDSVCSNGQCMEYAEPQVPFQEDATHLTGPGSIVVAERIRGLHLVSGMEHTLAASR